MHRPITHPSRRLDLRSTISVPPIYMLSYLLSYGCPARVPQHNKVVILHVSTNGKSYKFATVERKGHHGFFIKPSYVKALEVDKQDIETFVVLQ